MDIIKLPLIATILILVIFFAASYVNERFQKEPTCELVLDCFGPLEGEEMKCIYQCKEVIK